MDDPQQEVRDTLTRLSTVIDFLKRDMEDIRTRMGREFSSVAVVEQLRADLARIDRTVSGIDDRQAASLSKFESSIWKQFDIFRSSYVSTEAFNQAKEQIGRCVSTETFNPVRDLAKEADGKFVTKTEHTPVKNIAFGAVGVIVLAVLGALVALVVRGGAP